MNKFVLNGYVIAVGEGLVGEQISDADYSALIAIIQSKPTPPTGYEYKLRADTLEWELVEAPEEEIIDGEATVEDYESALTEVGVNL